MSWRRRGDDEEPNYFGGRKPDLRTYPGSLDEYEKEHKRSLAFQSSESTEATDMQIGDRYSYTFVNVNINTESKSKFPDAEELYRDILRKRKGGKPR